jgi:hypothetical protein
MGGSELNKFEVADGDISIFGLKWVLKLPKNLGRHRPAVHLWEF